MINKLWIFFIISGSSFLIINGKADALNTTILSSGKTTLDLIIQIFPLIAIWLGIMNIAKDSGLLKKASNFLAPLLTKIFPEIPKGHESLGLISSNIIANMFGLGNAATPFGLKAMNSLQKLNKNKEEATRSMITFLVINTCGVTLIPTTIISLRMMHDSTDPTSIVAPTILVTTLSLIIGLIIDRIFARRNK
ncbi:MAG: spore maturation protein [Bacilli bacterium]|nr:spore maturation protein [Bacilli bacterium]